MILDKQNGQCYNMLWICAQKCAESHSLDSYAKHLTVFCVCINIIFQRRRKKENANV